MGSFQVVGKWWVRHGLLNPGRFDSDRNIWTFGLRRWEGWHLGCKDSKRTFFWQFPALGHWTPVCWCWAHHGPTWTYACGLIKSTYSIYHLLVSYWPYLPMAYSTKFPWLQAWSNNRVRSVFKTERFKWFFEHVLSRMYGCHSPRSSVSRNMRWLILYTLVYAYNMHAFKNVQLQSLFNAL